MNVTVIIDREGERETVRYLALTKWECSTKYLGVKGRAVTRLEFDGMTESTIMAVPDAPPRRLAYRTDREGD